jgi:hypothetical protein
MIEVMDIRICGRREYEAFETLSLGIIYLWIRVGKVESHLEVNGSRWPAVAHLVEHLRERHMRSY